ncbi:hypothetical protein HI914_03776 [Erysiphe necator]|nr:hypothetical protein HI914_03776 [Erysiphe necator]
MDTNNTTQIINAQIEAALSAPAVIPNISFKSRRQKSKDLSRCNQVENPENDFDYGISDPIFASGTSKSSEHEDSNINIEFEKSIPNRKSSARSSTSSSTEPKELRLVSLVQKEMSEEAIRKRDGIFPHKVVSSQINAGSNDLGKRLHPWRRASDVTTKDLELSETVPTPGALPSEDFSGNLLPLFPVKYVNSKTNLTLSRHISIDDKISSSAQKSERNKINSEPVTSSAQKLHANDDDQISPANNEGESSQAKENMIESLDSSSKILQITESSAICQSSLTMNSKDLSSSINQVEMLNLGVKSEEYHEFKGADKTKDNLKMEQVRETSVATKIMGTYKVKEIDENNRDDEENEIKKIQGAKEIEETNGVKDTRGAKENEEADQATEIDEADDVKKIEEANQATEIDEADQAKKIEEADHVTEIDEADQVTEIDEADQVTEIDEADQAKKIEEADHVTEIDEAGQAKKIEEADQVTEIDEADQATEIDEADQAKKIEEADHVTEIDEADQVTEIDEADQVTEIDEADQAKKIEEADHVTEIDEADQVTEIDEADQATEIDEADQAKKIEEADHVTEIDEADQVTEIDEADQVTEIDEADQAKKIEEADHVTEIDEAGQAKKIEEADQVTEINEADHVKKIEEADHVTEINEADQVTEIDEADQAKKIKEADQAKKIEEADQAKKIEEAGHVTEIDEADQVTEIDEADHVKKIEEADHVTEINEADQVTEIDEADQAKKIKEADQAKKIEEAGQVKESEEVSKNEEAKVVVEANNTKNAIEIKKLNDSKVSIICVGEEFNSCPTHDQSVASKFVMPPCQMRYKRNISRDIAALKYRNKDYDLQPKYLSNSQPSTTLGLYPESVSETNTKIFKEIPTEIYTDAPSKNSMSNLSTKEIKEMEKFNLTNKSEYYPALDQNHDCMPFNQIIKYQEDSCINQKNMSLNIEIGAKSNYISSKPNPCCESPSKISFTSKNHDWLSTSSFSLSESDSTQLENLSLESYVELENIPRVNENGNKSEEKIGEKENIMTQDSDYDEIPDQKYSNLSGETLGLDTDYSKDYALMKSQFTDTQIEKGIVNLDESTFSKNEPQSLETKYIIMEEEFVSKKSNDTNNCKASILTREKISHSSIFDFKNYYERRLSYDSSMSREIPKVLVTALVTKDRQFITDQADKKHLLLSRSLSENDLSRIKKKYQDNIKINSLPVLPTKPNQIKESMYSSITPKSLSIFDESISSSTSEEYLSPREEISNTDSIILSSWQGSNGEVTEGGGLEIKTHTRIKDSEDEICNPHLFIDSSTSHNLQNPLVDQANTEYQHETSFKPSKESSQTSDNPALKNTTQSDQETSMSTVSFFQRARALFDNQQQTRGENYKREGKTVRPLSGFFNLRGGISGPKQRFDNQFLLISEDEESIHNSTDLPTENPVVTNQPFTPKLNSTTSMPINFNTKKQNKRTEQSRLFFYESLQRAVSTSPKHSPVFQKI